MKKYIESFTMHGIFRGAVKMNDGVKILKKFYEELGITPSVSEDGISGVDKRLILQKAVFIAQLCDVDLGYRYNWYIRGPYSPDLASDYYRFADDGIVDGEEVHFAGNVSEKINNVKNLLDLESAENRKDWLEALASIAFLIKKSNKTLEEAKAVVKEVKGHISDEIREKAAFVLENKGLI